MDYDWNKYLFSNNYSYSNYRIFLCYGKLDLESDPSIYLQHKSLFIALEDFTLLLQTGEHIVFEIAFHLFHMTHEARIEASSCLQVLCNAL